MRVVELFAGVGGFRIGFEGPPQNADRSSFGVVWSNQWEPTTKKQHAAEVYVSRWEMERSEGDPDVYSAGPEDVFVNKDIGTIDASEVPDHDLLCGGFPCQDYSVAKTASAAKGLEGRKGVLWWEILRILEAKMPDYALLENVDRLLKSPTSQRGRDFAVMLASLDELGYVVEWRDFAASDYGFPQRRKRVYILAHAPGTQGHAALTGETSPKEWLEEKGVLARAFPIKPLEAFFGMPGFSLRSKSDDDLADITDGFLPQDNGLSKFRNAGVMVGGTVWTSKAESKYDGDTITLGDVLVTPGKVGDEFIVKPEDMLKEKGWVYLKGAKSEPREGSEGFTYDYKEGPITFPDALDRPSRTMVTGEGGSSPSRFKHVVEFKPTKGQVTRLDLRNEKSMEARQRLGMGVTKWLRRLTPVELERLNGFPDNHTKGVTDGTRAFFMGNALVCGIVNRIGRALAGEEKPTSFFTYLSTKLLDMVESNETEFVLKEANGIGFTWKGYDGTQAGKKRKKAAKMHAWKQGLFDIFINTNHKYGHEGVTHRDILQDILDRDLLEEARRIWKGEHPQDISSDIEIIDTLSILALLMFEQEVNWGGKSKGKIRNSWQRETPYFYPYVAKGREFERRPRDCLMAYIEWAFENQSIEDLEFWVTSGGSTTLSPTNPSDRFQKSVRLFIYVDSFGDEGGAPVMQGELLDRFQSVAENFPNNPHLKEE
jgi:DNA (cytosine-5)-methyltransferase 1